MEKGKVSVIVAAYNVEKYINECILSIESQTYKNIEIVLIDDGSKDNTSNICVELSKKHNNIKLKHLEKNEGVSNARNLAISMCDGKYLMFVDGDDCIEENMISLMIEKIEKEQADFCACNYFYYYTDRKEPASFTAKDTLNKEETKIELFKSNSIRGFMCNKIFKTQYIKNNSIVLDKDINMCEDLLFCFEYIQYITKSVAIKKPLYNYRMRKSSASNIENKNNLSVFKAFEVMSQLDSKVYKYSKDLYTYLYFKYYKVIKKEEIINNIKKVSLLNCLFSREIRLKTKIYAILFLILPKQAQKKVKNLKKNNLQYFE